MPGLGGNYAVDVGDGQAEEDFLGVDALDVVGVVDEFYGLHGLEILL